MVSDVQPIFEFALKLRGLMDWAVQSNVSSLKTGRAIERATGIKHGMFRANINKEQMAPTNQEALAKAFGFRVDWPEWRDPDAIRTTPADRRRDCAEAFLDRFLAHKSSGTRLLAHKSSGTRLMIDAGMIGDYIDRRFADFKLAVAGSFEPSSAANGIPLVLSLSFDPRGWPVYLDLTVCLSEVDLQLIPKSDGGSIETIGFEHHNNAEESFRGQVSGVSRWWRITVAGGSKWLAGTRGRNDGQDCICNGFYAGDSITATMTARISDCFVTVDGTPLDDGSDAKKRFKEHLLKRAALGRAEVTLAEQILNVVEIS